MKTDLYTKSILTIIAACLTIIVLAEVDIIPKAHANSPNSNYGLVPLNPDGSIDVSVKSLPSDVDVNIVSVSTSDELSVKIEEVDSYAFSYCTVPVKVKD